MHDAIIRKAASLYRSRPAVEIPVRREAGEE
jgi:hypothetical protein